MSPPALPRTQSGRVESVRADQETRVAVVGDVGGHPEELRAELIRLGTPVNAFGELGELPADLVVIQVGDLVHRGPDSPGVVSLVDRYLNSPERRWVQLAGNHEAQYLRPPAFAWPERLDRRSAGTLRRWWADGLMQAAVALHTPSESFVITHAGLTAAFWHRFLASSPAPDDVAARLNAMGAADDDTLFRAGQMLGGGPGDALAGPLWACVDSELIPGWSQEPMPFSQVHGHTSLVDWTSETAQPPEEIADRILIDPIGRHVTVAMPGGLIVGVDPGHGHNASSDWQAWVIGGDAKRDHAL